MALALALALISTLALSLPLPLPRPLPLRPPRPTMRRRRRQTTTTMTTISAILIRWRSEMRAVVLLLLVAPVPVRPRQSQMSWSSTSPRPPIPSPRLIFDKHHRVSNNRTILFYAHVFISFLPLQKIPFLVLCVYRYPVIFAVCDFWKSLSGSCGKFKNSLSYISITFLAKRLRPPSCQNSPRVMVLHRASDCPSHDQVPQTAFQKLYLEIRLEKLIQYACRWPRKM